MKPSRYVIDLPERKETKWPLRPQSNITHIVIHAIAEFIDLGRADDPGPVHYLTHLRNEGLAAHYYIEPTGLLFRGVHHKRVAAHARGHNTKSIGIELVIPGALTSQRFTHILRAGTETITPQQDTMLKLLLTELHDLYPTAELIGHYELDPDRKLDPGSYCDMPKLREWYSQL